jgi:carbonic anhydrase
MLERETQMSLMDQALKANVQFAKRYDPKLGGRPEPKIAIVTCMDPRLSDLEAILGLKTADMDVIRTGGPAVTEDVLGELVVSTRVLGSKEIMLLNHTGCGFTTFTDKELNEKVAFKDPEENTRAQIEKVRSHPWIPKDVPVRGFIFDVHTGRMQEVESR